MSRKIEERLNVILHKRADFCHSKAAANIS